VSIEIKTMVCRPRSVEHREQQKAEVEGYGRGIPMGAMGYGIPMGAWAMVYLWGPGLWYTYGGLGYGIPMGALRRTNSGHEISSGDLFK
jgi:hypothetical protein